MSSITHRKRIARRLAALYNVTYQQAHNAVVAASEADALPTRLPGGLDRNLDLAVRIASAWLTTPQPHTAAPSVQTPDDTADPVDAAHTTPTDTVDGDDSSSTTLGVVNEDLAVRSQAAWEAAVLRSLDDQTDVVRLGYDRHGNHVELTVKELAAHVSISGCTGSGKTVAMNSILNQLTGLGMSGVVLSATPIPPYDPTNKWLTTTSRRLYVDNRGMGTSDHSCIDLFALSEDALVRVLTTLFRGSLLTDTSTAAQFVQQLVRLVTLAHEAAPDRYAKPSLGELGVAGAHAGRSLYMKEVIAAICAADLADEAEFAILTSRTPLHVAIKTEFAVQLAQLERYGESTFVTSGASRRRSPQRTFDLRQAGVTYVDMDYIGYPAISKLVQAWAMEEMLKHAADRIKGLTGPERHQRRFACITQANSIDRTTLLNFLGRARSAGIAVILVDDGAGSWDYQDTWDTEGKVAAATNIHITLRQGTPHDATRAAARSHNRVSPDQLRHLGTGEAILTVGVPARQDVLIKIALPE